MIQWKIMQSFSMTPPSIRGRQTRRERRERRKSSEFRQRRRHERRLQDNTTRIRAYESCWAVAKRKRRSTKRCQLSSTHASPKSCDLIKSKASRFVLLCLDFPINLSSNHILHSSCIVVRLEWL